MQKLLIIFSSLFISLFFISGCSENADSEDIRTSGIYAGMDIDATADNLVDIEVFLKVGGSGSNTYVNLTSGDTLSATLNDSVSTQLTKHEESGGKVIYLGSFVSSDAGVENSTIKISFERTSSDTSAPNSVVILPAAPSELTTDKNSFDRSDENISLTWNALNTDNNLSLKYEGDCVINGSKTVVDNGLFTFNAGTIKNSSMQNCDVEFILSRTVNGTLDSAFGEGGYIRAKQGRSISVISSP